MKINDIVVNEFLIFDELEINNKFIKKCESTFRGSMEYRNMLYLHREVEEENEDLFLNNIDFTEKGLTLEFHHIITLFDLSIWCAKKLLKEGHEGLTTFDVCNMLTELHYKNIVPYVFLSKTMHEVQHSEQLDKYKVEYNKIMGNYRELIDYFKDIFTEDDKKLIKAKLGIEVK